MIFPLTLDESQPRVAQFRCECSAERVLVYPIGHNRTRLVGEKMDYRAVGECSDDSTTFSGKTASMTLAVDFSSNFFR